MLKGGLLLLVLATAAEKRDLLAFLECLTDAEFLKDPRLGNPWKR